MIKKILKIVLVVLVLFLFFWLSVHLKYKYNKNTITRSNEKLYIEFIELNKTCSNQAKIGDLFDEKILSSYNSKLYSIKMNLNNPNQKILYLTEPTFFGDLLRNSIVLIDTKTNRIISKDCLNLNNKRVE